jgi:X-X-X-Leu-X-X-Gly heptad repeat protein
MISAQTLQKKLEKLKAGSPEYIAATNQLEEEKLLFESADVQMIDTFESFEDKRMELVRVQFSKVIWSSFIFF